MDSGQGCSDSQLAGVGAKVKTLSGLETAYVMQMFSPKNVECAVGSGFWECCCDIMVQRVWIGYDQCLDHWYLFLATDGL